MDATIIPYLIAIITALSVLLYLTLFFILRYHWNRFSMNEAAARRFLLAYGIIGSGCLAIMLMSAAAFFL